MCLHSQSELAVQCTYSQRVNFFLFTENPATINHVDFSIETNENPTHTGSRIGKVKKQTNTAVCSYHEVPGPDIANSSTW
jgi:hypothetical protein